LKCINANPDGDKNREGDKMLRKIPRIIYNDDSDTLRRIPPPHTEDKIAYAVNYMKKTQVDCLVWCIGEMQAYSYPAKRVESYFDKLKGMDSKHFPRQNDLMTILYKKGIDYLPLLIEECRRSGLSFVAGFRMNDVHLKSNPRGVYASRFWQEHQEYRLWEVTDGKTYFNACLDYSYPEVRNLYLTMVKEVAEMYDVDGIELDFCRSPYLFQPSEAWKKRNILTGFIRDVRRALEKAGREKGREIFLITRVPFGEDRLKNGGMDVESWLEKRLPDILVMSNLSNNYNTRIEPWLTMAHKKGVLFYPSIEADSDRTNPNFYQMITNPVAPWHSYNPPKTPEIMVKKIRAMAQNFLHQKPDGVYTFNYPCILNERQNDRYNDPETFRLLTEPLSQIGKESTLRGTKKLYTYWTECPISVETGRPAKYHQTIKFLLLDPDVKKKDTKIVLRFIEIAGRNPHAEEDYRQDPIVPAGRIRYAINGKSVSEKDIKRTKRPEGRILSGFLLDRHQVVEIAVPYGMPVCGENSISFEMPGFPDARDPYIFIHQLEVEVSSRGLYSEKRKQARGNRS